MDIFGDWEWVGMGMEMGVLGKFVMLQTKDKVRDIYRRSSACESSDTDACTTHADAAPGPPACG